MPPHEINWVVIESDDEDEERMPGEVLDAIIRRLKITYEHGELSIQFSQEDKPLVPRFIREAIEGITCDDVDEMMSVVWWFNAEIVKRLATTSDFVKELRLEEFLERLTEIRFDVEFENGCPWEKAHLGLGTFLLNQ